MEKIQFMPEGEDRPVDFYILEQTKLAGRQYLLVTDSEEGDGDALILRAESGQLPDCSWDEKTAEKPVSGAAQAGAEDSEEATYVIVEDEQELAAVLLLMRDSLEEIGIEIEI
ncbi:MAG: DUF1292 domain-containing protein [Eubacteriales bacterium]|nr:DUF1292 domain-containing protein [Eubacteriales bacterium]